MPDGGRLRFTTAVDDIDERRPPSGLPMSTGRYVRISVADSGLGMTPEVQARVFEPFFTTKERHKGTGLGLATAYGIVKQSGGFIAVTSRPGGGTVFDIYFPLVDAPVDTVPSLTADASRIPGGSETVLVAEDDAAVRRLVAAILRKAGYSVLEARDGEEALSIAERCTGGIDLLITDLSMPGIGGRTLAARLRGANKVGAVLYTSGYVEDARGATPTLDAPFLAKPFLPDQLLNHVRAALDGSRPELKPLE
jgi:CheY-like chemotaxis protein